MAVLMVLEIPGMTEEQYNATNDHMGIRGDEDAPDGLISHHAGKTDGGIIAVDVWESEEKLNRFAHDQLMAALQASGVEPRQPTLMPIHNMIPQGAGSTPGVLVLIDVDGFGTDTYDEMTKHMDAHVREGSGHPAVSHVAARKDDGSVFVADVWESPEAFGAFAEQQIGPAGAAVGLGPVDPRFAPVIGRLRGRTDG